MNDKLKPIPNSICKKELFFLMYPDVPKSVLMNEVNTIIYDLRKDNPLYIGKTPEQFKKTKTVYKNEILELFKVIGVPNGYSLETENQ